MENHIAPFYMYLYIHGLNFLQRSIQSQNTDPKEHLFQ